MICDKRQCTCLGTYYNVLTNSFVFEHVTSIGGLANDEHGGD